MDIVVRFPGTGMRDDYLRGVAAAVGMKKRFSQANVYAVHRGKNREPIATPNGAIPVQEKMPGRCDVLINVRHALPTKAPEGYAGLSFVLDRKDGLRSLEPSLSEAKRLIFNLTEYGGLSLSPIDGAFNLQSDGTLRMDLPAGLADDEFGVFLNPFLYPSFGDREAALKECLGGLPLAGRSFTVLSAESWEPGGSPEAYLRTLRKARELKPALKDDPSLFILDLNDEDKITSARQLIAKLFPEAGIFDPEKDSRTPRPGKMAFLISRALPPNLLDALIHYATLPLLISGDAGLSLAVTHRRPFYFEKLIHKLRFHQDMIKHLHEAKAAATAAWLWTTQSEASESFRRFAESIQKTHNLCDHIAAVIAAWEKRHG